jgi:sec-independent protein translocase protein TatC
MSTSGSSVIDEDTAQTVASGRETIGAMLSSLQTHLQKVFIVFVVGFIGTFYGMSAVVWPFLKEITTSEMPAEVMDKVEIIAVTPFDVVLLQAKVAMVGGVLLAVPVLLYLGRESIRNQSWYPDVSVSYWQITAFAVLAAGLFVGGLFYGYSLFFPLMFNFLAKNAVNAGFSPKYGIVEWTQFVIILSASFGIAAEMPLIMSGLGYSGIVKYETFRDKWRYAVLAIFAFGAMFSPPDPFTQLMWAAPLVILYAFSLYLTKIVVTIRRGSGEVSLGGTVGRNWNTVLGVGLLAGAAAYAFVTQGGRGLVNEQLLPTVPAAYRPGAVPPVEEALGLPRGTAVLVVAVGAALVALLLAVLYYFFQAVEQSAARVDDATGAVTVDAQTVDDPAAPSAGAPAEIDLDGLDAAGVRAAPPEVFAGMTEEQSLQHAQAAMDDDDSAKAQAILDRFDEANEAGATATTAGDDADEDGDAPLAGEAATESNDDGNVFQSTAAGMANAFTEEETTEDDVGGYYYDLAFIFRSLTSKMFRIVGVFMLVLASVFVALYRGGIGVINEDFTSRVPQHVVEQVAQDGESLLPVVTLHPVEALVFEVKISTLIAAVAVLPMVLYYAWPAIKERGITSSSGDRRVFFVWGGALVLGLFAGSFVGYAFVAPNIISWLVVDAHQANMEIAYRVKNFFWLVFATTVGIGLLANVPVTMLLFERGDIVSYDTFRSRWRVFVIGTFAVAGLVTPDSLYTMFLVAIPASLAYGLGLGTLWSTRTARTKFAQLVVVAVAGFSVAWVFFYAGGGPWLNQTVLPMLPSAVRPASLPYVERMLGVSSFVAISIAAVGVAMVSFIAGMFAYAVRSLESRRNQVLLVLGGLALAVLLVIAAVGMAPAASPPVSPVNNSTNATAPGVVLSTTTTTTPQLSTVGTTSPVPTTATTVAATAATTATTAATPTTTTSTTEPTTTQSTTTTTLSTTTTTNTTTTTTTTTPSTTTTTTTTTTTNTTATTTTTN